MNKTIYVADCNLWNRAKRAAETQGISLSRLIAEALTAYLDRITFTLDKE